MGDSNRNEHYRQECLDGDGAESFHMGDDGEDMMMEEDELDEGEEAMVDEDGNVMYDDGHAVAAGGLYPPHRATTDPNQPNLSTANAPSTLLGSVPASTSNPQPTTSRTAGTGSNANAAASSSSNPSASASLSSAPQPPPPPQERVDPATAKRKAIQAIMQDSSLTEREKGLRIQQLMDGRPSAAIAASSPSFATTTQNGGIGEMIQGVQRTQHGQPTAANGHAAALSTTGGGVSSSHAPAQSGLANSTTATANGNHDAAMAGVNGGSNENMACVHYDRKCFIVAPCCNGVFGCRVCHDEMVSHGPMDRFAMREVVCKDCRTRQPAKTNNCINCGVQFAEYHCARCNLWMPKSKQPFHCDGCGFCRVGGRDAYRHCDQCCMCISRAVYAQHNCMKDKYKNNCPVCREDMFSSRQSPQDLPCGHAIHAHCFRKLAGFDYRCPICKKTVVSQSSMAAAWAARARDIELQPMPPDLTRVVNIMCNDCETKSERRNWHFLGVQCPNCSSFNTAVENLVCQNANGSGSGAGGAGGGESSGGGRLPDASPSV